MSINNENNKVEDLFENIETERLLLRKIVDDDAEDVRMYFESIREDGYKIGDNYYNQNVYTIINK